MNAKRQLAAVQKRRTAPPEERREQLIQATIRCVADRGLADTTIATVAQEAGLSQGIVNLHFRSKDGLLTETLRYLADEYRNACQEAGFGRARSRRSRARSPWSSSISAAPSARGTSSRSGLRSGASGASGRPTGGSARSATGPMTTWCASSAPSSARRAATRDVDPALVADGLSALTDGLWLDLLVRPDSMSRERARRITLSYLADVFPRHFSQPEAEERD